MLAHLKIRNKVSIIWFFFEVKSWLFLFRKFLPPPPCAGRGPPAGHQLPASSSYGRWESPLSSVIQGTNSLPPPYKPRSCNKMHRHAMKHSSFVKFLEVCSVHSYLYIIGRFCVFETKKWPGSKSPHPIKWKNYFVRWENSRRSHPLRASDGLVDIKRTFSFCKSKGIVGHAWGKTT